MKKNSASIRSRNIIINEGEDELLLDQIKKDAAFNAISIDTVGTSK